jgi:FMN phosphatase YigB (HAD superfamily)
MVAQVTSTDIVAVIFDFDDTLVPDSTSKLLKEHGIDPTAFWQHDARRLIEGDVTHQRLTSNFYWTMLVKINRWAN